MAGLELLEYYKKMCKHHIVLDFQGAVSQDMLVVMTELIKSKFAREYGRAHFVRKVISIFIELAQNISAYSAERVFLEKNTGDVGTGIIVLSLKDRTYTITSGNHVEKGKLPEIIRRCEDINRMTPGELKSFYKERMRMPREKGRNGAGLGLITVARKAGCIISYTTTPVNGDMDFLVLSVNVHEDAVENNSVSSSGVGPESINSKDEK